jgi:hypothetical protein
MLALTVKLASYIWDVLVFNPARTQTILTEDFHGFPPDECQDILVGYEHFLPIHFEFTEHHPVVSLSKCPLQLMQCC